MLPVLHALLSVLVYRTEWEIENACDASNCSYKRNVNRCIPMLRKAKVISKSLNGAISPFWFKNCQNVSLELYIHRMCVCTETTKSGMKPVIV